MDERRTARVSEAVREELSEIVSFELDDPRLAGVEITEVHVSPDSRHAKVKVALSGSERETRQSLAALAHAAAYLRHELAGRLELRHVPELHFEQERHPDAENRVDLLLKRAHKTRGKDDTPQS